MKESLGQGQIVDPAGSPIPNVRVFILPAPEDQREEFLKGKPEAWYASGTELTTDASGTFPLAVQDLGIQYALVARKPGYGWVFQALDPHDKDSTPLQLTMKPTEVLYGTVKDTDGNPISEATVSRQIDYVWTAWKTWPAPRALYAELTWEKIQTDKEGCFSFQEVTSSDQVARASAPGYATCDIGPVSTGTRLNFTLCPAAVIYGQVTDRSGRPIEGALVRSMTYGCIPFQATEWLKTDEQGHYELDGALSGSIGVVVYSEAGYGLDKKYLFAAPGEHTQVDFILQKGGEIGGELVDSQSNPAVGILVFVMSERTGIVVDEAETDENGAFQIGGCIPGESYVVGIPGTDDYAPRYINGIAAGSRDLEVRLLGLSTLWGKVAFSGEPAKKIRIRFLPRKNLEGYDGIMWSLENVQGSTQARYLTVDGRSYTHEHWPGVYDVEFRAGRYAPIIVRNVTLTPGKIPRPVDLHFEQGTPRRGMVVDHTSGQPIPGARVEILEEHYTGQLRRSAVPIAVTTDAGGRFALEACPKGSLTVEVLADGYAPKTLRNINTRAADAEPVRVELFHGGSVQGQVGTKYANPSNTLEVTVREIGRRDGPSSYVEANRRYSVDHVPPGRVEVVLADHYYEQSFPNVGPQVRQVEVRDGETVEVNFDAATGVTLSGQVVGWDKPLLIEARAIEPGDKTPIAGASFTDREGRFHIPHLRPGRYRVGSTVGQPGYSIAVSAEVAIAHEPPDELLLEVPGTTVHGTVQDEVGQPIPRAVVTIEPDQPQTRVLSRCLTDGEGGFAVGGIDEGHYTLRARARGRATTLLADYQAPGPELSLALQPEARLSVTVKDDLGAPLPGARVGLRHTREPRLTYADITGVEGMVLFTSLQAYPHQAAATLEGHVPADPLIVPLREAETRSVTLVLVRTGSIDVSVNDPDGKPSPKTLVILSDENGAELSRRLTDKKGNVLFEDLAPAWYELAAGRESADAGGQSTDAVEVLPGEKATLDLVVAEE